MKCTTEGISNIKTVKLNTLENNFLSKINSARNDEIYQTKLKYISGSIELMSCMMMAPLLILSTFAILLWYVDSCSECSVLTNDNSKLKLSVAFASIQIFSNLEHPIRFIPLFVRKIIEFNLSIKRIYSFLECKEIDRSLRAIFDNYENAISTKISELSWTPIHSNKLDHFDEINSTKEFILKNINLQINKGEFICVIGTIGSGKSSLLSALIGDLTFTKEGWMENELHKIYFEILISEEDERIVNAPIKVKGSISYLQQNPWILNTTIRDNIQTFKDDSQVDRYNEIIQICQLCNDLSSLPHGDLTEIGEKGINLSGGQKARIQLARALYANCDIILMDDPLAALDSHVKSKIFDEVIVKYLNDKTRILVTHSLEYLSRAFKTNKPIY